MQHTNISAKAICGWPCSILTAGMLLTALMTSTPAVASDKLMVEYPTVNPGETEIGMRVMALSDNNPDVNNSQTRKLGAGYGFTNYWFSELYAEYEKPPDSNTAQVQYYEWENMLRLGEPGMHWADWAVILEYSRAADPQEQDSVKLMPIMQTRFSHTMLTLNFGFGRNPTENNTNHWQLSYGWQYLWLGNPAYRFALEGYGQVGDVNHWAPAQEQTHQIGPALVGKVRTSEDSGYEYNVGVFWGVTQATPDRALMASIEYEL
jgi:hypothetical protein